MTGSKSPSSRRKVDASLQYRWGVVGVVLAIGFFAWYLGTSGNTRQPTSRGDIRQNQEKILCPRCQNDPERKTNCSLCGGLGQIWVDKNRDPGRSAPAQ